VGGVLGLAGAHPAGGQSPLGDEFQINTYTTGIQDRSSVGVDANGNFVVVWASQGSVGTDTSYRSVQGQRYASDGSPHGGPFQVNTYATFDQRNPSVAVTPSGGFVVVWQSQGSFGTDTSNTSIQGQRYASNGSLQGGEFQVNVHTTNRQSDPFVAAESDGDFIVVWQSQGSIGSDTSNLSVHGQRYASDGSKQGVEFQVNTYTTNAQYYPAAAVDSDGDFIVVWQSGGSSGTDPNVSVQGQRYASNGSPQGGEFQVNTYTTGYQRYPSVAADADGNFVVVWESWGSFGTDPIDLGILGQRYLSDGSTQGGEFQVNTHTPLEQRYPSVSGTPDGDFVVVWQSQGSFGTDASNFSIQGQRYASNGSPQGGEFQVNTYTTGYQRLPSVATAAGGDLLVVWESQGSSGTDTSFSSIQGQLYGATAKAVPSLSPGGAAAALLLLLAVGVALRRRA
jgi:hypothetical protein